MMLVSIEAEREKNMSELPNTFLCSIKQYIEVQVDQNETVTNTVVV